MITFTFTKLICPEVFLQHSILKKLTKQNLMEKSTSGKTSLGNKAHLFKIFDNWDNSS